MPLQTDTLPLAQIHAAAPPPSSTRRDPIAWTWDCPRCGIGTVAYGSEHTTRAAIARDGRCYYCRRGEEAMTDRPRYVGEIIYEREGRRLCDSHLETGQEVEAAQENPWNPGYYLCEECYAYLRQSLAPPEETRP